MRSAYCGHGQLVSKFWVVWTERERVKNVYFPLATLKAERSQGSGQVTKLVFREGKRRIPKSLVLPSCK